MSGLIWVQTVCKGYQQMTKVATSGERDKTFELCHGKGVLRHVQSEKS